MYVRIALKFLLGDHFSSEWIKVASQNISDEINQSNLQNCYIFLLDFLLGPYICRLLQGCYVFVRIHEWEIGRWKSWTSLTWHKWVDQNVLIICQMSRQDVLNLLLRYKIKAVAFTFCDAVSHDKDSSTNVSFSLSALKKMMEVPPCA